MKNKVAIVYSDYYKDVTSGLLDGFNNTIDSTFECDEFKAVSYTHLTLPTIHRV